MASLTFVAWVSAIALFLWLVRKVLPNAWQDSGDEGPRQMAVLSVIWLIVVFGLTSALVSDIFKVSIAGDSFMGIITWWIPVVFYGQTIAGEVSRAAVLLISGFVALGTVSIGTLGYNLVKGQEFSYYSRSPIEFGKAGSFVIQAIGLIGSILGILSFYLDYLK